LGKEFSANAIGSRFTDFSPVTPTHEDKQPVLSASEKETVRPSFVKHETKDKQPFIPKGQTNDDSPVGCLFSVLTPDRISR
jgi:hypothetical protein